MKPAAVVFSKFHEDVSTPLGSFTVCLTDLKHWMSRSEAKQVEINNSRRITLGEA
jgi:hypothetical protein